MNVENRRQERKSINIAVRVDEGNGYYHDAITADVSLKGLCLFTGKDDIQAGQVYNLKFELPVRGKFMSIATEASVVHAAGHGSYGYKVGMQFTQIDTLSTWTLESFIVATAAGVNHQAQPWVWTALDSKSKRGQVSS